MTDSVGQLIRKGREARGLTLEALAKQVGATKGYLSMIENHRVSSPPSESLLVALEDALGIEDQALYKAAAWQNTPDHVRREYQQQVKVARQGQQLAKLLKGSMSTKNKKSSGAEMKQQQSQVRKLINATLRAARSTESSAAAASGASGVPGVAGTQTSVPLINKVAAGYPMDFTDLGYPARVADEYVPTFALQDPDAFALRVVGDSMEPRYGEGDIIIFSPQADVADGDDCLARIEPDHETTFKRVFFEGGNIRLQPLNPAYAPMILVREKVAGLYKAVQRIQVLGG